MAFLPLIHLFRITPYSKIFALQVVRSLFTPASSVNKRHQLSCRHRSRKDKERKATKREKRKGVGLANYISLLKNTMNGNKYIDDNNSHFVVKKWHLQTCLCFFTNILPLARPLSLLLVLEVICRNCFIFLIVFPVLLFLDRDILAIYWCCTARGKDKRHFVI